MSNSPSKRKHKGKQIKNVYIWFNRKYNVKKYKKMCTCIPTNDYRCLSLPINI